MQAGREIKFRGMGVNGEWHYGYLSVVTDKRVGVPLGSYISNKAGSPFAYQVRPETVGQNTGHRDKNEREIYEKDIWLHQGCETPRVIVWHRYGWWFQYPNGGVTRPMEWTEDGEVIGNIYENPELLEVGK